MMVVITLTSCPQKLKGDLTRWLFEIDTGVYVGNLSARVRDELWERICDNIGSGRVSMAYSANNEQKLDFRIKDDRWEPVDYDGIRLVRRNYEDRSDSEYQKHSKAAVNRMMRRSQQNRSADEGINYTIIDVETTGLSDDSEIIEMAALRIRDNEIAESVELLVQPEKPVPKEITELTGITDEMLRTNGVSPEKAMRTFTEFIGEDILVGHNVNFDLKYIRKLTKKTGLPPIKNRIEDTMKLARKKAFINEGYSLASLCRYLGIDEKQQHRALEDCKLTYRIYDKLKKK